MILVSRIKENTIYRCGDGGGGEVRSVRSAKCCPPSNVSVAFQGVWSGDVKEKHRHRGRRLPSNTHHRVKGALLRFGCPYQRDAQHSKSCNKSNHSPKHRMK